MEKASPRTFYHCLSLAEFVGFLILDSILIWISRLHKSLLRFLACSSRIQDKQLKNTSGEPKEDLELNKEDVEMVMKRIGMSFSRDSEMLKECMGFDELSTMFEEKQPSLEEVEEALCVFDENCDGFIDTMELQRVLCKLGFREGMDLDACQLMIAAHDENRDGRIDFNEFIRFMESSFA